MSLVVPTFASTVDAMNNRMKARQEGRVPQGYLSEYDWNQYGRNLEAENKQIAAEQEAGRQANPQQSGPMATGNQTGRRFLGPSTPAGQVPAGIKAANPGAYFDPRTGSSVIGASGRNKNARGGPTWAGGAVQGGQTFWNTNNASFGMPAPNERRGPIGGRGTPPAPDRFGHQFDQPTGPAPMGTTQSGGQSHAPMPWELPGYANGGEVDGPGGPKDDLIPAMLSDGEFIMPAEAVKFYGVDKLNKMKEKAKEGMAGMQDAGKVPGAGFPVPGFVPGYAAGGMVAPPSIYRAMADQDVAAEANYISPAAIIPTEGGGRFNRKGGANTGWESEGMGHFLFPQPGIDASQRAQASTGRAIADISQFMDAQRGIDAGFDAQTARRRAMLDRLNDPAAVARMAAATPNPSGAVETGMAYGPTMNDHPALNAPDHQTLADMRGRRAAIRAQDVIPGMIPPTLEPQGPIPAFAPRFVGQPGTGNPAPGTSPTPFLAPWEKDAARAAAADAASGRPEGVRKSDWRNFMRSPQGMMFGIQRQDQAAQDAQRERVRLDEQAVAVNRDIFRTNTGIQMDAMNRAASTQAAADARAVDENYRMAAENRKIGNEAAMRSAENNAPPQDIPGTDYVRTAYGNLPKTRPAPTSPPGMVPKSMTVGGVRYEVPEGDKPAGPLKIRAKLQPKGGFEMVQWSDGLILPSPRNISPTDKQKEDAYKAVTGQDLDSKNAEHWSDAYYFARGERPPKWTQTAAAPAASPPAAKIREFATPEEAMKAGLKPGDRVMVGGRAATWK